MRGLLARDFPYEPTSDDFLRPADAFSHPQEVVCDPDLSINEKRAILASWASDASAIEAMPDLRKSPAGAAVAFDDIMEALKELDALARHGQERTPKYRRWVGQGDMR